MLAAAAGYFEHQSFGRQDAPQHIEDRIAITDDMRIMNARIGCFSHHELFPYAETAPPEMRPSRQTKKPRGFPRGFCYLIVMRILLR